MHEHFLSENLLERDHVEDPGEDEIILKRILQKWCQSVDLIQVAQHRVHRWAVLNAVMNFTLWGIFDPLSDYQIVWKDSARKYPFVCGGENKCKECGHIHSFSVQNTRICDQK
jgi:hypothetical protein